VGLSIKYIIFSLFVWFTRFTCFIIGCNPDRGTKPSKASDVGTVINTELACHEDLTRLMKDYIYHIVDSEYDFVYVVCNPFMESIARGSPKVTSTCRAILWGLRMFDIQRYAPEMLACAMCQDLEIVFGRHRKELNKRGASVTESNLMLNRFRRVAADNRINNLEITDHTYVRPLFFAQTLVLLDKFMRILDPHHTIETATPNWPHEYIRSSQNTVPVGTLGVVSDIILKIIPQGDIDAVSDVFDFFGDVCLLEQIEDIIHHQPDLGSFFKRWSYYRFALIHEYFTVNAYCGDWFEGTMNFKDDVSNIDKSCVDMMSIMTYNAHQIGSREAYLTPRTILTNFVYPLSYKRMVFTDPYALCHISNPLWTGLREEKWQDIVKSMWGGKKRKMTNPAKTQKKPAGTDQDKWRKSKTPNCGITQVKGDPAS
jgi:hypothetical protein